MSQFIRGVKIKTKADVNKEVNVKNKDPKFKHINRLTFGSTNIQQEKKPDISIADMIQRQNIFRNANKRHQNVFQL